MVPEGKIKVFKRKLIKFVKEAGDSVRTSLEVLKEVSIRGGYGG